MGVGKVREPGAGAAAHHGSRLRVFATSRSRVRHWCPRRRPPVRAQLLLHSQAITALPRDHPVHRPACNGADMAPAWECGASSHATVPAPLQAESPARAAPRARASRSALRPWAWVLVCRSAVLAAPLCSRAPAPLSRPPSAVRCGMHACDCAYRRHPRLHVRSVRALVRCPDAADACTCGSSSVLLDSSDHMHPWAPAEPSRREMWRWPRPASPVDRILRGTAAGLPRSCATTRRIPTGSCKLVCRGMPPGAAGLQGFDTRKTGHYEYVSVDPSIARADRLHARNKNAVRDWLGRHKRAEVAADRGIMARIAEPAEDTIWQLLLQHAQGNVAQGILNKMQRALDASEPSQQGGALPFCSARQSLLRPPRPWSLAGVTALHVC